MPASPSPAATTAKTTSPSAPQASMRGRAKLFLILLICAAPALASYYVYYFVRPDARSNYGDLIEPQRPLPPVTLHELDQRPFDPTLLKGKWLMVMVDQASCNEPCADKLYHMRQVRLTTGKERERVQTVWLITDRTSPSAVVLRAYAGTLMLHADEQELKAWLPAAPDSTIEDHIYVVDPHGNLMMRFPKNADPNRTKKDLAKLLSASSIG